MKTIQLQIRDEFLEEFLEMLPKDKVHIIDDNFMVRQIQLQQVFESYKQDKQSIKPLYDSLESLNSWLKEQEEL